MASVLARVDDGVAKVERVVVLACLGVMSLVVFFDVVHRVWSTPTGILLKLMATLTGASTESSVLQAIDEPAAALLTFLFYFAALRTAGGGRFGTALKAGAGALVLLVVTAIALQVLMSAFPNGLVWSQNFALALLLWVSLVGSSLATKVKAHIILEVADKLWPSKILPHVKLFSGVGAGLFSYAMVALGMHFVGDYYDQWKQFGVGYVSGAPIPLWAVYAAIPVSFTVMGTRFIGYAIDDWRHPPAKTHNGLVPNDAPVDEAPTEGPAKDGGAS